MTNLKNNYLLGFIILVGFILLTVIFNLSFIEIRSTFGFALINENFEHNRRFISSHNTNGYDKYIFGNYSNTTISNFTKSSHFNSPGIKTEAGTTISTRYDKLTSRR